MKSYLTDPDSCQHSSEPCHAVKTRAPLRVLQIFSVLAHPSKMSASTRSGVPRTNLANSRQSAENKLKKNSTTSLLLKERSTANISRVNTTRSASPNTTVDGKVLNQSVLSTSRTKSSKVPTEQKTKSAETSSTPSNKVGSLTSSPKWSRIKDKFENTDTDLKGKLTRSSSLSRSEIESLTPKKFTSQSTSKSLTSLSFESNLSSSQRNAAESHSSSSKSGSENLKNVNTRHRLQSNLDDKIKSKFNGVPGTNAQKKESSEIFKSSRGNLIASKTDEKSKNVPLSAKAVASRLMPPAGDKSEPKTSISATSKKSLKDRPIMGYGPQNFGKVSGRRSPYRSVSQASRTKTDDTKEMGKNEAKSTQRDVDKTSSSIKDVFQPSSQVSNKTTSDNVRNGNNTNSTMLISSGDQQTNANFSSQMKGHVKSLWVKDNIGGWRKQNPFPEMSICTTTDGDSKIAALKSKYGSFSSDCTAQGAEQSQRGNRSQLLRSSTTSNVPAKQNCDDSCSEIVVRQLNKSSTTSNISSVALLKNQNEENQSVNDTNLNKAESLESPRQPQNEHAISLENKLKNCHATADDNTKQGSPENIRKLRLVKKAVLCYEGNSSTLSPETQRKLKLISEKIKAETDDDKLLVAKAKVGMLSASAFRKHNPTHSKSNGGRTSVTSNGTQKNKGDAEQSQSARSFLSRYQNRQGEDAKKTNLNTFEKTVADSTEPNRKTHDAQEENGVKQVSSLSSKSAIPKQSAVKNESSVFSFCRTKKENLSVEKDLPHTSSEENPSNAKESPEHSTYANYAVDNRFLFAKEKQFPKKLPHANGKISRPLQPNTSFLWRNSSSTEEEPKDVYSTSAKQKEETDDHNYYDLENHYSSLETNRDKIKFSEPIYSSSEYQVAGKRSGSMVSSKMNGSPPSTQTAVRGKLDTDDGWTDLSDEDNYGESCSKNSSLSSTLKKKKNKKHSTRKAPLRRSWSQSLRDIANASDSCENSDWVDNESNLSSPRIYNEDMADHLYEPVYESLGNYLITDDFKENTDVPLSPDSEPVRYPHSSFTSLESEENNPPASKKSEKSQPDVPAHCPESSTGIGKKAGDKIRQLKRHLSWSKNDIKLELSSKSNKIKIQKDLNDTTEIGVRVQEDNRPSVTSKKKTFIHCILKHKNSNVPAKRTLSPKKENALFYVHLSMGREKQRPCSDSYVDSTPKEKIADDQLQKQRKRSEPNISFTRSRNSSQQSMRLTKTASSGATIQRPKTPPPLPPTNYSPKDNVKRDSSEYGTPKGSGPKLLHKGESEDSAYKSYSSYDSDCVSVGNSSLLCDVRKSYSVPDSKSYVLKTAPQDTAQHRLSDDLLEFQIEHRQSITSLSSIIDSFPVSSIFFQRTRGSLASSVSGESYAPADESGSSGTSSSTAYSLGMTPPASEADAMDYGGSRTGSLTSGLSFPAFGDFKNDLLKSPFEEEPMYQFYHKDVQQRATLWCTTDGSESEFEDDMIIKPIQQSTEKALKSPPVLQSQLSAMELIHGEGGQRTLWCEVPEVQQSGIMEKISPQDRKIQEAMFEVITSEASYLKSLNFLLEHFVQCPEFSGVYSEKHVLDKRERHILFSDIPPVRDVSARLLADLEKRWLENIVLSNICDIIYHHASRYFSVYVKYCSNQLYQERTLKELKENRPEFVEVLKRLESNPVCQGLDMHSFLLLPMQRITRLPLLIDAVFHRISVESPIHESCKMALANLNKIVAECNEGARKMERMEEMLLISHQLDFRECKGLGLLSSSRWLVKKGELVHLLLDTTNRRTFGKAARWSKIHLYVFLFTDLLVITRKKSDDNYSVVDYCPRNMVQVMPVDENTAPLPARLPSSYKNLFQLIMLNNQEGRTVEMILSCLLESDRTRWMDALTPAKSENPDEKIYEEWDCPQVQCTHSYTALQPDELSLEEADVVNVFRKMADGWYEGERIRDGVRGWFPSSHTVEIISSHVRARNLRQRYRLLVLSQNYLEEQYRAHSIQTKGK